MARKKNDRTGETRTMNCGMEATIIEYRGSKDIDVEFSDGSVSRHKPYESFRRGSISPPKSSRVGETRIMNCGLEATIIAYRSSTDIDIEFTDGSVKDHTEYGAFRRGSIAPPKINRIGEKRTMHCGMEAKIIEYTSFSDITVQFSDGALAKHSSYEMFLKRTIAYPIQRCNQRRKKIGRLYEKRLMKCGMEAEIVAYRYNKDIDVKFEDGRVVCHRTYKDFEKGKINPTNGVWE